MYCAFTPNSVFKSVPPLGSEPTWQTSMLYLDIVPLIYVMEKAMAPHKSHGGGVLIGCSPWGRKQTWLSDFTFTFHSHVLEKEMATHSSVLAWRIPGMGEPSGLPSVGWHRVGHDWSNLAAVAAAIYVNETICMVIFPSIRFKSIVLWASMNHLVPRLPQNASYGWGAGAILSFKTFLSFVNRLLVRRQWHPTPVLLPGKSHGWRSLVGCSPWGH